MARVVLVGKGAPERGGIPSFLHTVLSSDLTDQHQVELLNLAHAEEPRGGRLTAGNAARTLRDVVAVWQRGADADVVHLHTALAPGVTALRAGAFAAAARLRGAGVIVHAHGGLVSDWMDRPSRRLVVRAALAPANLVLAVSSSVEPVLARVTGRGRVRLVPNGVDVDAFAPRAGSRRTPGPPRVLYAGLLTPRKGVLDLFEASRLLTGRGVEHELLLVGGTPTEGAEAEAQVRAAAPPTARLLGPRDPVQMPAAYRDADIFCLPSWWEAMPLSVLEAMASGLPVVCTDVGDVARVLDGGAAGVLVEARRPDRLADALERLLTDPSERARLGEAARRRVVEQFSSHAVTAAVGGVYEELGGAR
jgi:glycosyltransferase involved in cell wall biosynthesis